MRFDVIRRCCRYLISNSDQLDDLSMCEHACVRACVSLYVSICACMYVCVPTHKTVVEVLGN